jgi:pimeloyl-ACP methyl ester carboxylesterase
MHQKTATKLGRFLLGAALLCAGIYILLCLGCATFQRRMIYFPPVYTAKYLDEIAPSQNLERWRAPSGKPIGWKRLAPHQPSRGQILITHGNAGCAFQCAHYADAIQQVAAFDIFIVEYPGYADRPGVPTEKTLDESADEAFQLLDTNAPIYLVGESLGTGVSAYLAGRHPDRVSGIALLAAYNRLADVAKAHMPLLPVKWILCDRFPAENYLKNFRGPVAITVALDDTVVPAKFGERLYDDYAGPKRLWEIPRGNHGAVMTQPAEFWRQVISFWCEK